MYSKQDVLQASGLCVLAAVEAGTSPPAPRPRLSGTPMHAPARLQPSFLLSVSLSPLPTSHKSLLPYLRFNMLKSPNFIKKKKI